MSMNPRLLRRVILGSIAGMLLIVPAAAANPPEISVTIVGTLGANGWYRSNVTINWTVVGAQTSTGCDAVTLSVDTPGRKITCSATNGGDETTKSVTIKLDKTMPSVTSAPERPPDANGWYNRALTVAFGGTDATSGVASCSSTRYAGPDNGGALVSGSCADNAGNAASTAFAFKYDATPPSLFAVSARRRNRSVDVAWRKSTDTQLVEVLRAPGRKGQGETAVYRGTETGFRDTGLIVGRKYEYRIAGVDEAANRTEQKVDLVATGALLSPTPAERVTAPPNLVWTRVKRASYYNLQLIFRGRKVLSTWPLRSSYQLRRTWRYEGHRYRLRPGVYRWYVWPGRGRISAARYGRLLGSSTFVVAG